MGATRKEAAAHLFVSVDTFDRDRRAGRIPAPRGKAGYDLDEVRRHYLEALRTERKIAPEAPPADAKADIDRARYEKIEMDNAIRRREYAPIALFETYVEKVGAVIHSHFEALAGQVKQRIPHLRGAEVAIIRNELAKCASGIADFKVIDEGTTGRV